MLGCVLARRDAGDELVGLSAEHLRADHAAANGVTANRRLRE